ncbi:venom peptide SjAPI-like [Centruroides vittatus]|uniref:venom peptide SjAPI-like n=1 Tax=Centruroides vittatus TaxID=120091 RepID=UPI00350FC057
MLPLIFLLLFCSSWGDELKCGFDEQYSQCLAHCQSYCNWTTGEIETPPCPKICVNGCICEDGYVRQLPKGDGFCIPGKKCKQCPEHEYFDRCSAQCQNSCKRDSKPLTCPSICAPGCMCDDGYAREDGTTNSPCVRIEDCPK